jgi:methylphosphotriester-DNA--protein-cysteine methyltransferase
MNGQTRKRKTPGELREVLAQNINRLMEQRYKETANRPLALAKDAGVSLSSVQRTLSRETGATVDTVEAFAKVFGLPPFQLLVPWGLLGELASRQMYERNARASRKNG